MSIKEPNLMKKWVKIVIFAYGQGHPDRKISVFYDSRQKTNILWSGCQ